MGYIIIVAMVLGVGQTGVSSAELDHFESAWRRSQKACGPISLSYCLSSMGRPVSGEDLAREIEIGKEGVAAKDLLALAAKHDANSRALICESKSFEELPIPSILILDSRHCVVFEGLDQHGGVSIFEPAVARRMTADRARLAGRWTGEVIVFADPNLSVTTFVAWIFVGIGSALMATLSLKLLLSRASVPFAPRDSGRPGFTLLELIVVLGILAILLALVFPAVQKAREAGNRARCATNLRQIGLALHQYHDRDGFLPAGVSNRGPDEPFPFMSWGTRILPYLEHDGLWRASISAYQRTSDFRQSPPHLGFTTVMPIFSCPSDDRTRILGTVRGMDVAFTDYLGVEGTNQFLHDGVLYLNSRVQFADIGDGLSNTLFVGERPPSTDGIFGWWYAGKGVNNNGTADVVLGVNAWAIGPYGQNCPPGPYFFFPGNPKVQCHAFHYWSHHPGGSNFLFGDGHVQFIGYPAAGLMSALASRRGGEVAQLP